MHYIGLILIFFITAKPISARSSNHQTNDNHSIVNFLNQPSTGMSIARLTATNKLCSTMHENIMKQRNTLIQETHAERSIYRLERQISVNLILADLYANAAKTVYHDMDAKLDAMVITPNARNDTIAENCLSSIEKLRETMKLHRRLNKMLVQLNKNTERFSISLGDEMKKRSNSPKHNISGEKEYEQMQLRSKQCQNALLIELTELSERYEAETSEIRISVRNKLNNTDKSALKSDKHIQTLEEQLKKLNEKWQDKETCEKRLLERYFLLEQLDIDTKYLILDEIVKDDLRRKSDNALQVIKRYEQQLSDLEQDAEQVKSHIAWFRSNLYQFGCVMGRFAEAENQGNYARSLNEVTSIIEHWKLEIKELEAKIGQFSQDLNETRKRADEFQIVTTSSQRPSRYNASLSSLAESEKKILQCIADIDRKIVEMNRNNSPQAYIIIDIGEIRPTNESFRNM